MHITIHSCFQEQYLEYYNFQRELKVAINSIRKSNAPDSIHRSLENLQKLLTQYYFLADAKYKIAELQTTLKACILHKATKGAVISLSTRLSIYIDDILKLYDTDF